MCFGVAVHLVFETATLKSEIRSGVVCVHAETLRLTQRSEGQRVFVMLLTGLSV